MNTPFDIFMASQQQEAPQATKSAAEVAFENAYWQGMAEKAASFQLDQTRGLFNEAFEVHTQKLAALDPEYAEMLQAEQVKQAFNLSYQETLAAAGFTA